MIKFACSDMKSDNLTGICSIIGGIMQGSGLGPTVPYIL